MYIVLICSGFWCMKLCFYRVSLNMQTCGQIYIIKCKMTFTEIICKWAGNHGWQPHLMIFQNPPIFLTALGQNGHSNHHVLIASKKLKKSPKSVQLALNEFCRTFLQYLRSTWQNHVIQKREIVLFLTGVIDPNILNR